jgi:Ran GTPase-activating protein (RanGAP) involved in mRNA processing and transport
MTIEEMFYFLEQSVTKTMCGRRLVSDGRPRCGASNATTKRFVAAMMENTSLTALDLVNPTIFAADMRNLASVLLKNTRLVSLKLSYEKLNEADALMLANVLVSRTALTSIDIRYGFGNKFGSSFYQSMEKAVRANTRLRYIGLMAVESNQGLIALAEAWRSYTSLATIHLPRLSHIQSSGFKVLVNSLYNLPSLTLLDLRASRINPAGAEALAEFLETNHSLVSINLDYALAYAGVGNDRILSALKINNTLTSVYLSSYNRNSFSAQLLAEVVRVNTRLTSIVFRGNGLKFPELLAASLKVNTALTSLDLSRCGIRLSATDSQALKESLAANSSLLSLNLSENYINTQGAQALAEALMINSTLTHLDLYKSEQIGQLGVSALFTTLEKNSTLTSVNLSEAASDVGLLQATTELMRVNTSLTSISLPARSERLLCLGDEPGSQELLEALRGNSSIMYFLGRDCYRQWNEYELNKHYGSQFFPLLIRNRRRSLFVTSPRGLKNTILYSLFHKPVVDEAIFCNTLPHIIQFQLTQCAIDLQALEADILRRAIMAGWCCACGDWGLLETMTMGMPDYFCSYA